MLSRPQAVASLVEQALAGHGRTYYAVDLGAGVRNTADDAYVFFSRGWAGLMVDGRASDSAVAHTVCHQHLATSTDPMCMARQKPVTWQGCAPVRVSHGRAQGPIALACSESDPPSLHAGHGLECLFGTELVPRACQESR